jgi:hypothetical protein
MQPFNGVHKNETWPTGFWRDHLDFSFGLLLVVGSIQERTGCAEPGAQTISSPESEIVSMQTVLYPRSAATDRLVDDGPSIFQLRPQSISC